MHTEPLTNKLAPVCTNSSRNILDSSRLVPKIDNDDLHRMKLCKIVRLPEYKRSIAKVEGPDLKVDMADGDTSTWPVLRKKTIDPTFTKSHVIK